MWSGKLLAVTSSTERHGDSRSMHGNHRSSSCPCGDGRRNDSITSFVPQLLDPLRIGGNLSPFHLSIVVTFDPSMSIDDAIRVRIVVTVKLYIYIYIYIYIYCFTVSLIHAVQLRYFLIIPTGVSIIHISGVWQLDRPAFERCVPSTSAPTRVPLRSPKLFTHGK